jgi:hypothetical protein
MAVAPRLARMAPRTFLAHFRETVASRFDVQTFKGLGHLLLARCPWKPCVGSGTGNASGICRDPEIQVRFIAPLYPSRAFAHSSAPPLVYVRNMRKTSFAPTKKKVARGRRCCYFSWTSISFTSWCPRGNFEPRKARSLTY